MHLIFFDTRSIITITANDSANTFLILSVFWQK